MLCKNRVAIVTGAAGRGIGRSIALTLAREGAKVVVNYRSSEDHAEAIVQQLNEWDAEAVAVKGDVSTPEGCEAVVDAALSNFGQVDIGIINPGAGWDPKPIHMLDSEAALEDSMKELAPIYHLMPLLLPGMYERGWGRIIAVGLRPPYTCPDYTYGVGKAARAHAVLLARDQVWEHGVTINVLSPAPVAETGTLEQAVEQCRHGDEWLNRRTANSQDVAEAAAFLCSEAGRFISGCEVPFMFT